MLTHEELLAKLRDGSLREDETVELKIQLSDFAMPTIIKCMVAMANTKGGYIIVGARETRYGCSIVGVKDPALAFDIKFRRLVDKNCPGIQWNIIRANIDSKTVLIINVIKSEFTIYYSNSDTSPERQYLYIRKGDGNIIDGHRLYQNIYKYMTVDAFINCMYHKSWRFFEPNKWNDKFERRFYCADYKLPGIKDCTPRVYATCVTRAKNSEAAWKVYANGEGLNARCIELELDVVELRKQLGNSNMRIEERSVEYLQEHTIMELHKKTSSDYSRYFHNFTLKKFIDLLSVKRDAYQYEKEIRLFIIPQELTLNRSRNNKSEYIDINIAWDRVIKSMRISKKCSDAELTAIQYACFSAGINLAISSYHFITQALVPAGLKNVSAMLFDIDEMPGTKKIIIK